MDSNDIHRPPHDHEQDATNDADPAIPPLVADVVMAGHDEEEMPELEDVSDSSDSDSDDDMSEANNDDDDGAWTDVDSDMPPLEPIPARSAPAQPQGRRRARVDDGDDERDRRHPSQRISNAINTQATPSSSSSNANPLPNRMGNPLVMPLPIHATIIPVRSPSGGTPMPSRTAPTPAAGTNTPHAGPRPFRFFQHFMQHAANQNTNNNQNNNNNNAAGGPHPPQAQGTPASGPTNANAPGMAPMNGQAMGAFLQNLLGGIAIHINMGQGGRGAPQQQQQGQAPPAAATHDQHQEDREGEEGAAAPNHPQAQAHAMPFPPFLPPNFHFRQEWVGVGPGGAPGAAPPPGTTGAANPPSGAAPNAGPNPPPNLDPNPPPNAGPNAAHPPNFRTFVDLLSFLASAAPPGMEREHEDHERAERLVRGLEVVPEGLVRRLERAGKVLEGKGTEEGEGEREGAGDGGCAVCWERLVDDDEEGVVQEEEVSSAPAPSEAETASSPEQQQPPQKLPLPHIVSLPCAHIFHSACLLPWFARPGQTTCPTCRFNIDPENLTYVSWGRRMEGERRRAQAQAGGAGVGTGAQAGGVPAAAGAAGTPAPAAAETLAAGTPAPQAAAGTTPAAAAAGPAPAPNPRFNGPFLPPPWGPNLGQGLGLGTGGIRTTRMGTLSDLRNLGFMGPFGMGMGPGAAQGQGAGTGQGGNAGAAQGQGQGVNVGNNNGQPEPNGPEDEHDDPPLSPLPPMNLPAGDYITIGFDVVFGPPIPIGQGQGGAPGGAPAGERQQVPLDGADIDGNPALPPQPGPGGAPPVGMFDVLHAFADMAAHAGPPGGGEDGEQDENDEGEEGDGEGLQWFSSNFPLPFGMAPPPPHAPRRARENKAWAPPPPPGPTLRQRIERKEREAGLRCFDVSCGVGPSDEDPYVAVTEEGKRQLAIHVGTGMGEEVCAHRFHSACLVSAERVAMRGAEAVVVGNDVEVSCPVCRGVGCVSKKDWDEGVQALV